MPFLIILQAKTNKSSQNTKLNDILILNPLRFILFDNGIKIRYFCIEQNVLVEVETAFVARQLLIGSADPQFL